ncbi:unnamed protein product [Prunus armeniaca]|uniref:mRNA cap-binding protein n=1 Tax=Prunus armeniaca TaxID=36596 RepID=A0A6J5XVF5_PRUAR|nr:unnamed protein product [Prunus armeniaca]
MELVAEKESDQQNNNNNNSEKNNNTSYAQALVDSHDYNTRNPMNFVNVKLATSKLASIPSSLRSNDYCLNQLVEGFWVCYCHLARPATLPSPTDLHLFKDGIRPLWEDSANCHGGKWIIRFKKAVSGRFWEDLVLALVGDQLDYGENICGAVLSIRFNEDILSVWNRNASDHQAVMALRDAIKRNLKLPHSYLMEYKPHDASLRDNSSYRNTWLRG